MLKCGQCSKTTTGTINLKVLILIKFAMIFVLHSHCCRLPASRKVGALSDEFCIAFLFKSAVLGDECIERTRKKEIAPSALWKNSVVLDM